MENEKIIKTQKSIDQNISSNLTSSNQNKFKIIPEFQQFIQQTQAIQKDKIFRATVQNINSLEVQIFKINAFQRKASLNQPQLDIKICDIEQPKKLQVKVNAHVQKNKILLSLNRSKSQHKNLKSKRNFSGLNKYKTLNATRFSNKLIQSNTSLEQLSLKKQSSINHKRVFSSYVKEPSNKHDDQSKKAIKKKVRLKTNSVVSISGHSFRKDKNTQCMPLEGMHLQQQDNFWEKAYRIRKGEVPVWYQISTMWDKAEQKKKLTLKQNVNGKQHKKSLYQSYDFNGELIPTANYIPKIKKSSDQAQLQVSFKQNGIQNLVHYHQRQQRYARTVKKIKVIPQLNCTSQLSSFLDNFQKVQWHQNVETIKVTQKLELQLQNEGQNQHQEQKQGKSAHAQTPIQSKNNQEEKQLQQQRLLKQFQKIKMYQAQEEELNIKQPFSFGISKYVKAKKFHQKENKSKSYNSRTCQYFSVPKQCSQINIENDLKIIQPQKKGNQKIRANKRLFKEMFDMSLKFIEPQNREDVVTIKLIKSSENKQNDEEILEKIKRQEKKRKTRAIRNSDTMLLKKGFQPRKSFSFFQCCKINNSQLNYSKFVENKNNNFEESEIIQELIKQQNLQNKTQNLIKSNAFEETNQRKNLLTKKGPILSSKKVLFESPKNVQKAYKNSNNLQNLQKMFKKETKKVLTKHSLQQSLRQTLNA